MREVVFLKAVSAIGAEELFRGWAVKKKPLFCGILEEEPAAIADQTLY
jgi:hypothetical protein